MGPIQTQIDWINDVLNIDLGELEILQPNLGEDEDAEDEQELDLEIQQPNLDEDEDVEDEQELDLEIQPPNLDEDEDVEDEQELDLEIQPPNLDDDHEILLTLKGELERVEKFLTDTTNPGKPAILAGKFRYAESVGKSTKDRLKQLDVDQEQLLEVEELISTVENAILSSRSSLVQTSLERLTSVAEKYRSEASELQQKLLKNMGDERDALYLEASEALAELSRELADWAGQVKEAKDLIKDKAKVFDKQVEILEEAEKSIDEVVAGCLPKLTSKPAGPGDKLPESKVKAGSEGEVIDNPLEALRACGMSWVNAKQKYGANKTEMQKLANYRQKRVDEWLESNLDAWGMKKGPDLGWVSVGSQDPTSDYDISLNRHGKNEKGEVRFDYQLVQDFNSWFRKEFGGEGGTVFDTNLYASAPPLVKEEGAGAKSTNDVAALMKMRRYMTAGEFEEFREETVDACGDNKEQRMEVEKQFALADSNYRIVVEELLDNGRKMLENRIKARENKGVSEQERETHSFEKAGLYDINDWFERGKKAKGIEAYELIEDGEELLRVAERLLKDSSLETTNEVYAEKIGQVRGQEQVVKLLQDLNAALQEEGLNNTQLIEKLSATKVALGKIERTKNSKGSPLYYESAAIDKAIVAIQKSDEQSLAQALEAVIKVLSEETGVQLNQLGSRQVISRYFANEAYQSDGPFAHIVTATQAAEVDALVELAKEVPEEIAKGDQKLEVKLAISAAGGLEKFNGLEETQRQELIKVAQQKMGTAVNELKKKRQAKLPPEQCLQSFNEQLGDFLKDLEHYGDEEPGKAIIQSSKYLERLLDATRLLKDKEIIKETDGLDLEKQLGLQSKVKNQLIAARKGNLMMIPLEDEGEVDQQEQRRAFACDFMKKELGVNSVSALAKMYVKFGVKVNAVARKSLK